MRICARQFNFTLDQETEEENVLPARAPADALRLARHSHAAFHKAAAYPIAAESANGSTTPKRV